MAVIINDIVRKDLENSVDAVDWSAFEGKRVLVTGANGHIASWLALTLVFARRMRGVDVSVTAMSRDLSRLRKIYGDFETSGDIMLVAGDVASFSPGDSSYDYIFHFAGNASPHFIDVDPVGILHANIEGTFSMSRLACRQPGCKLIYASTREVYGRNTEVDSLSESDFGSLDPLDARSCYPESKRAAEAVLEAYRRQHGLRYAVARIAHVYGPGMNVSDDGRVMSDFIGAALSHTDIHLNSDGSALRSFCYVTDAVEALLLMAALPEDAGVYNLSNETEEISVLDLARKIADLAGGISVSFIAPDPAKAALYCAYRRVPLDCARLVAAGWNPRVTLDCGLRHTLAIADNNQ